MLQKDVTHSSGKGKSPDDIRTHEVGFAVRNPLLGKFDSPTAKSGVPSSGHHWGLRHNSECLRSHTLLYYWRRRRRSPLLRWLLLLTPPSTTYLVQTNSSHRYFNARVGAVINPGQHVLSLMELCTNDSLCITNSYFQTRSHHKASCCMEASTIRSLPPARPCGHQAERPGRYCLLAATTVQTDCDSSHALVCCKVKPMPKHIISI